LDLRARAGWAYPPVDSEAERRKFQIKKEPRGKGEATIWGGHKLVPETMGALQTGECGDASGQFTACR